MDLGSRMTRARCALVWVAASVVAAVLVGALLTPAGDGLVALERGTVAAAGFASVLVWVCAAVGVAVTCWLWLATTVVVADAWRGVAPDRRGIPLHVRRATLVLCGVALTGLPTPVLAAGGDVPPVAPHVLSGLRLPERTAVAPEAPRGSTTRPPAAPVDPRHVVVVEPGDTLWGITADQLGPGARDDETARAWPAVYALNRAVIGSDPGRIEPGQRLVLPTGGLERSDR